MRRLMAPRKGAPYILLLAIGLSALLWTAAAGTAALPPGDIIATSDGGSCVLAGDPHAPGDSDAQWRVRQHTFAPVTESVWKSAPVHAELAAAPTARALDAARASSSPDPPVRPASRYLRHTPLLI